MGGTLFSTETRSAGDATTRRFTPSGSECERPRPLSSEGTSLRWCRGVSGLTQPGVTSARCWPERLCAGRLTTRCRFPYRRALVAPVEVLLMPLEGMTDNLLPDLADPIK